MNTRRRCRKVDESDFTNIQSKMSKKIKTTHTDTDGPLDTDEHQIVKKDSNEVTMNIAELATSSTERLNDGFTEFDHNSNSADNSSDTDTLDTDNILREADVLIAEIAEFHNEMTTNLGDNGQADSDATIIIETTDATHPTNQSTDEATTSNQENSSASTSASSNHTNIPIDDSVVLIEDTSISDVRPIVRDDDEDVIFVTESRGSSVFRTVATIDLCDIPDTSFSKDSEKIKSTASSNDTANEPSPIRPGTFKCPICFDVFAIDKMLSTICGHLYCEPCIRNAIKTNKKCPMCNRSLKANQVHRIFLNT